MPRPLKSDAEIKHAVLQELAWDTRVKETEVGVEVDRGVVTLTEVADSYAKKLVAQEAAHHVVGVTNIITAIRRLMRLDIVPQQHYDVRHLRLIHSVGEPLNPKAVVWDH